MILEDAVYATTIAVFGKSESQQYGFAVMEKLLMGGLSGSDLVDLITDVGGAWESETTEKIRIYADIINALAEMNAETEAYKTRRELRKTQNG